MKKFQAVSMLYMFFTMYGSSDYSFISNKAFMDCARSYKDTQNLQKGDIVYVDRFELKSFFTSYHPTIKNEYILITHGGFLSTPGEFDSYLADSKLLGWFTKNPTIKHKKIKPLPNGVIGNEQIYQTIKNVQKNAKAWYDRSPDKLVYMNFSSSPTPESLLILSIVKSLSKSFVSNTKNYHQYLQEMSEYKFVICPTGLELDSHQVWEALLIGTIPIVQKSTVSDIYKDLPVVVIKEWKTITESFLKRKISDISKKEFNLEKLTSNYWINQIKEFQKKYQ